MFFFFFFKQNTAYEMRISDGSSDVCSSDLLVLVNGRRFIPANADGSVDLATIPDALVERVEIITGGASAVYGSDAIAGAVNLILKDDFEGPETSYQYGTTLRDKTEERSGGKRAVRQCSSRWSPQSYNN